MAKRGILAEGVLIVVSILVAFAIDAWWEERKERDEERRILQSLRAEFRLNAELIPPYIRLHERSLKHGMAMSRALSDAGPGEAINFEVPGLMSAISSPSTDPHRGALDAILQSGELRYIRNPQIRERLASWPQLVIDATENEVLLRTLYGPSILQVIAKHVDISPIQNVTEECWTDMSLEVCQGRELTLPYDTEIIGLLMPIAGLSAEAVRELQLLVEEALAIVELIDRELAGH